MKNLFTSLNGKTVRLVVELNNLKSGTETFGCFDGYPYKAGSKLANVQFVEYGNKLGKNGKLELVKEIQVSDFYGAPFKSILKIVDIEYIDDAYTFVVTLEGNRTVQVQFEKETNRLNADYGTYYAHIDRVNDYGYDLSDEEEELFKDWILTCREIKDVIDSLDNQ